MENNVSRKDDMVVNKKRVIVAGDLVMDNNLAYNPTANSGYYEITKNIVNNPKKGGAWHLKEIIDLACSDLSAEILARLCRNRIKYNCQATTETTDFINYTEKTYKKKRSFYTVIL